ncbi:MAG: TIGR03621 family F420-dependent LLM class oxidoreductase [Acidimicrobiia bacterium]
MTHPFEFAVSAPTRIESVSAWTDELRRIEDMGFAAVVVADHFTDGYDLEPMVALTAAAAATTSIRLQTGVLCNDYRHPVLTARMAASLDVVSNGRFTLGLGAGWMRSDYDAAGIQLDPAGVRVGRLEEAIRVITGLLAGGRFTHVGEHYQVDLELLPATVQRPLPLFVGGGSPRVLGIAGRHAQIVGVLASLGAGALGRHAIVGQTAERVAEKIGWVREAATAAGRAADDVRIEMNHWLVRVTATSSEADEFLAKVAMRSDVDPALLSSSPAVLVGTVDQITDLLVARREQFGISCIQLDAGFAPKDIESLAPIVAALAGT